MGLTDKKMGLKKRYGGARKSMNWATWANADEVLALIYSIPLKVKTNYFISLQFVILLQHRPLFLTIFII